MKRADILVLDRDLDAVTAEVGRLGLMHLEQARLEGSDGRLRPVDVGPDLERRRALAQRVDDLAGRLGVVAPETPEEVLTPADPEAIEETVAGLEATVGALIERRDRAVSEETRLQRLIEQVSPFEELQVPVNRIEDLDFLHVALGTVPEDRVRRLRRDVRDDVALVPVGGERDGRRFLLAVSSKKGRWALQTSLDESAFEAGGLPGDAGEAPAAVVSAARTRLREVRGDLGAVEGELAELARQNGPLLVGFARQLDIERRMLQVRDLFGKTDSATLISGWVPAAQADLLVRRVQRAVAERAVIEIRDPEDLGHLDRDPPVAFSNRPFFKPFELLVSGYGTPTYTEVEPTPFVAVTYLAMFGLMFGDVGQGAVLALVGWLIHRRSGKQTTRQIGMLMLYAGLAAVLFGLVYNSAFGKEGVLPWEPLLEPLAQGRHVQVLLLLTVGFGILVITLGSALNIINRLGRRDFLGGVLDRFGLVGMVVYWGAIGLAVKALVFGAPIRGWEPAVFIGAPLLALFFKEPIYAILTHKHKLYHEGVFNGLMEAGVEMLETFSGFLANTLSFLRVGAFALAHIGLCVGIFEIEKVVRGAGGVGRTIGAIAAVAVGNAIIITLEGLVVGIQAVRLEYYEFFSRFFGAGGRAYKPFEIGSTGGKAIRERIE